MAFNDMIDICASPCSSTRSMWCNSNASEEWLSQCFHAVCLLKLGSLRQIHLDS